MGVPRLFRWIVERYPLVLHSVHALPAPLFDHLYLDFNGIVHKCTHGDGLFEQKSEKEVMSEMFSYVERLFQMVAPKKLLFIGVDGVATRAKLNNQRQRRFLSAQQQQLQKEREGSPDVDYFDSNCITPGTEFMQKLTESLKFFVQHKIDTDPSWQGIEVIVSGAEVPGEGEHKIGEFIRSMKSKENYDPTTSHCMYGLDADLIMLGLATHEPYLTLLREKVVFRPRREQAPTEKKEIIIQTTNEFQFFSVGLLREYLALEFTFESLPFEYNLERIIDDIVFLSMLVGNDFIPSLPFLEIDRDGLPSIFNAYRELLPTWKQYLVAAENGTVKIDSLKQVFIHLSKREREVIQKMEQLRKEADREEDEVLLDEPVVDDLKTGEMTTQLKSLLHISSEKEEAEAVSSDLKKLLGISQGSTEKDQPQKEAEATEDSSTSFIKGLMQKQPIASVAEVPKEKAATAGGDVVTELKNRHYLLYLQKSTEKELTPALLGNLCARYIEGLVWTLNYYYHGHLSWKWYYEFYAAPFASDLANINTDLKIKFEMDKPFTPFQQLLAVLPPASKSLLPLPYQEYMTREDSPIKDFFPSTFEFIMDEKGRDWKNIAVIPFIDSARLVKAASAVNEDSLTPREKLRNQFGRPYIFVHDRKNEYDAFPSPFFETKKKVHCKTAQLPGGSFCSAFIPLPHKGYKPFTIPPKSLPTLRTKPFGWTIKNAGVNVVGTPSRSDTMVLQLSQDETAMMEPKELAHRWLGRSVFINWPYCLEARVVGISQPKSHWSMASKTEVSCRAPFLDWNRAVGILVSTSLVKFGIGIESEIKYIFHVCPIEGMQSRAGRTVVKFADQSVLVAPQSLILNQSLIDGLFDFRFEDKTAKHMFQLPVGSKIVHVGSNFYGCLGQVIGKKAGSIMVELEQSPPISLNPRSLLNYIEQKWYFSGEAATMTGISPFALSRITGLLAVQPGEVNLGLGIKYSRRDLVVAGYAKTVKAKHDRTTWCYSESAVQLIQKYKEAFPEFFSAVEKDPGANSFDAQLIFGEKYQERVAEALEWLANSPVASLPLVSSGTSTLTPEQVSIIEKELDRLPKPTGPPKLQRVEVGHAGEILDISLIDDTTLPLPNSSYGIGDRVLNIRLTGPVPVGLRGTIITLQEQFAEVLWDEEYLGGTNLGGRCRKMRGGVVTVGSILNLSKPNPFVFHNPARQRQAAPSQKAAVTPNPYALLGDNA